MNKSTPPPTDKDDARPATGGANQLGRLERALYSRETPAEWHERSQDVAQLGIRRERLPETTSDQTPVTFVNMQRAAHQRRRHLLWTAGGLVVFGILLAGGVGATIWYRLRQNVTADQIALSITAPAQVQAGEEVTYDITYGNSSHVNWENVEVAFELPTGLEVTATEPQLSVVGQHVRHQVGGLTSGTEGSFKVTGRLLGAENATVVGKADMQITPENFPSGRFTKSALLTTTITAAPLEVALAATREAAVGERVAVTMTVTNKSEAAFEGAYLELNPAVGMTLVTADSEFSPDYSEPDRRWELPPIASLQTLTRTVILSVAGEPGEQRTLDVQIGLTRGEEHFVQQRASLVITIASAKLAVDQRYQSTASPLVVKAGEKIQGLIRYTNAGTEGLKNVVVRAKIEGDSFDPASLRLKSGAYDPSTKTITWTSATVPELALLQPQQSGEITYEFAIKPAAALPAVPTSKNSTIVITAGVDSPDVPVPVGQARGPVQDQFVISVASDITLAADAFYDDGRLGITSTGPVPPQAGQETTYSVRLRLGSTLNDIGDVQVKAVLPDGVRYTDQKVVTTGSVEYEERTGELLWSVPQVAGLTGRATPTADLYFQVAIIPGENQHGAIIPFLNRLTATGMDLFVDQNLTYEVTTFPTTESAVPGKGRVE